LDDNAVRESRRALRRVQDHLIQSHVSLGAIREMAGLVDVFYHPSNRLADLNYVTPRRNTAWVSGKLVEQGLTRLQELERNPRVQYIEGLLPPLFAKTLRELNLELERETPIMLYKTDGFSGVVPPPAVMPPLPDSVTIQAVNDQRGIELWWYVWRNAYYDVLTLGVEPLFVGRDMAAIKLGHQIDILAYRQGFPVGVVRISIQDEQHTGHIVGLAVLKEARSPTMTRLLIASAMRAALARQCTLLFAPGETDDDRRLCRELGFVDMGSVVAYGARPEEPLKGTDDGVMAQPILALR